MKVISYFDETGNMVKPWRDAGYQCYILDNQHSLGDKVIDGIHRIRWDLSVPWLPPFDRDEIAFFCAFPPCTDLSVSGAKHFKNKGLRSLQEAVGYFASSQEFADWCQAPYMIENPVSTMSTYWRKPDHNFNPCDYTFFEPEDNYTKKTCLWTGNGYKHPDPCQIDLGEPDDRICKAPPGDKRAAFRSATPMGFARAVFHENKPQ